MGIYTTAVGNVQSLSTRNGLERWYESNGRTVKVLEVGIYVAVQLEIMVGDDGNG